MNKGKRDCPISMKILPCGGGWTEVYANFGDGELKFTISYSGDTFTQFMKSLYHMYPAHTDLEEVDYSQVNRHKFGIFL